jgi:hypothetical protein
LKMKVSRIDFLKLSEDIFDHGAKLRFQAAGDSMRPFIRHVS